MPSLITRYLNTLSSGGNGTTNTLSGANAAYATLATAFSDIEADYPNFVTADINVVLECSGTESDFDTVTPGFVTNETCNILIRSLVPSARFSYTNTSAINGIVAGVDCRHWTFQDIDIDMQRRSEFGNTFFRITPNAGTPYTRIRLINCTARNREIDYNSRAIFVGTITQKAVQCINCVFNGFHSVFTSTYTISGTQPHLLYNTTILGAGNVVEIEESQSNTLVLKNVIMQGSGTSLLNPLITGSMLTSDSDTILTQDGSSPTVALRNITLSFANSGSGDFRLASSDTAAIGSGLNLSADSYYPFSTDINGTTRTGAWDVGAFDYISAGIPTTVNYVVMRPSGGACAGIVSSGGATWFRTL
jgi:hypothetical protein